MPNDLKPYDDAQLKRLFALYNQGKFPAAQLHEYRNQGLINDAAWTGAFVPSMRERGDLDQEAALQRFQAARPTQAAPPAGPSREQLLGQMLGAPVIAGRVPIPDRGFLPGNRPQSQGGGLGPSPFRGYNR